MLIFDQEPHRLSMFFPDLFDRLEWLACITFSVSFCFFPSLPGDARIHSVCVATSSFASCQNVTVDNLYSLPFSFNAKPGEPEEQLSPGYGGAPGPDDDSRHKPGCLQRSTAYYILTTLIRIRFWAYGLFSSIRKLGVVLTLEDQLVQKTSVQQQVLKDFFRPDDRGLSAGLPGFSVASVELLYMDWSEVPEKSDQVSLHITANSGNEALALVHLPFSATCSSWGEQSQQEEAWQNQPMLMVNYLTAAWQSLRKQFTAPVSMQCNCSRRPPAPGAFFHLECGSGPAWQPARKHGTPPAVIQLAIIKPDASQQVTLPPGSIISYSDNVRGSSQSTPRSSRPSSASAFMSFRTLGRSSSSKKQSASGEGGGNRDEDNPFNRSLPVDFKGYEIAKIIARLKETLQAYYEAGLRSVKKSRRGLARFLHNLYIALRDRQDNSNASTPSDAQAMFLQLWNNHRDNNLMTKPKYKLTHKQLSDLNALEDIIKTWDKFKINIVSSANPSLFANQLMSSPVIFHQLVQHFSSFGSYRWDIDQLEAVLHYLFQKIIFEPTGTPSKSSKLLPRSHSLVSACFLAESTFIHICAQPRAYMPNYMDSNPGLSPPPPPLPRVRDGIPGNSHPGLLSRHIEPGDELKKEDEYIEMLPRQTVSGDSPAITREQPPTNDRDSLRGDTPLGAQSTSTVETHSPSQYAPRPRHQHSRMSTDARTDSGIGPASHSYRYKFSRTDTPGLFLSDLNRPIPPLLGEDDDTAPKENVRTAPAPRRYSALTRTTPRWWRPVSQVFPDNIDAALKSYHPFTSSLEGDRLTEFVRLIVGNHGNQEHVVNFAHKPMGDSKNLLDTWLKRYVERKFSQKKDWTKALDDLQKQVNRVCPEVRFDSDGSMISDEYLSRLVEPDIEDDDFPAAFQEIDKP